MPLIDPDLLKPFAARFLKGSALTPSERAEILRIAEGLGCKDSAAAASVSPETIRARRKRIYRKLDAPGASELLASMLALSLGMLASGERLEPVAAPVAEPVPQPVPATDLPTGT